MEGLILGILRYLLWRTAKFHPWLSALYFLLRSLLCLACLFVYSNGRLPCHQYFLISKSTSYFGSKFQRMTAALLQFSKRQQDQASDLGAQWVSHNNPRNNRSVTQQNTSDGAWVRVRGNESLHVWAKASWPHKTGWPFNTGLTSDNEKHPTSGEVPSNGFLYTN